MFALNQFAFRQPETNGRKVNNGTFARQTEKLTLRRRINIRRPGCWPRVRSFYPFSSFPGIYDGTRYAAEV